VEHLSAFFLSEGSPAIDAGMNLQIEFSLEPVEKDLAGQSIPEGSGYDLGALEYNK
jgi:hypothetical protein